MRGRKPKIDGEKRGHCKKEAPLPPVPPGAPDCPAYVTGEAKKEWTRILDELHQLGRCSPVFRASIEGAALATGQVVKLQRALPRAKDSRERASLGRQLNQYLTLRLKHLAELGLTPVSRARAKNDSNSKPSGLAEFLGRGGDLN